MQIDMKSFISLTVLLLGLCVASCTMRKENSGDTSFFNIPSETMIGNPLTFHKSYIMLDSDEEAMFTEISKMMYYKERLFIFDGNTSSLYIFDMSGRLQGKLDRVGQGPGEYLRLRDFDVKDDLIYLYDDRLKKILCYDLNSLEYRKSVSTPFFARAMSMLDNGNILFVLPKDQNHKQIVVTDGSCNILTEYIDFKEKDEDNITRYSLLQKTNRGIVYSKMCSNDVYVFSSHDGTLQENFQVLLDGEAYDLNDADGPELISTPLLYKNGLILGRLKKDKQIYYWESSMSHKEPCVVRKVGTSGNGINELYDPVCSVGDSMVASYILEEMYEKTNRSLALEYELENYLADGGFLICLYEVK